MKESQFTGVSIWRNISSKLEAIKELDDARDAVDNALGRDNSAYRLLSEQLFNLKKELTELERTTYALKSQNPFA